MNSKYMNFNFFFVVVLFSISSQAMYDVCIMGPISHADGTGSIAYALNGYLNKELSLCYSFVETRFKATFENSFHENDFMNVRPILSHEMNAPARVLFFASRLSEDVPDLVKSYPAAIKIAFSVFESTEIPSQWVTILNDCFDLVVVPDIFLIDVYKKSGVTIPVFCIAQGFFKSEPKHDFYDGKRPFRFGSSARNLPNKNLPKLIHAFHTVFGNNPDVELIIHTKDHCEELNDSIHHAMNTCGTTNVSVSEETFNQEAYFDFIRSLDCYVLISQGEGFSLTPREALSMGVPCIITDNTAHSSICQTGLVCVVKSPIKKPFFYFDLCDTFGYQFDCFQEDVEQALRDMFDNYSVYKNKSVQTIQWARQFEWESLVPLFKTLFKPESVILGEVDAVDGTTLITTSPCLYEKYCQLGS